MTLRFFTLVKVNNYHSQASHHLWTSSVSADFPPSSHFYLYLPRSLSCISNLDYKSISKNLILPFIYNLSSVQQILNNRNSVFNSISSWRTERIKTSIGPVSILSPRALGDSVNRKMNSHPGTAVPRSKQTSGPNRLLKVIDGFTITAINSWKHPDIFINHLLKTGNALRA